MEEKGLASCEQGGGGRSQHQRPGWLFHAGSFGCLLSSLTLSASKPFKLQNSPRARLVILPKLACGALNCHRAIKARSSEGQGGGPGGSGESRLVHVNPGATVPALPGT